MERQPSYVYSSVPHDHRISRVISNPLTNSFNSVEAIVDNINVYTRLPELYDLALVESNLDYETTIAEEDLKPTYPELPSFTPNSSDVTLFKMLADGIVNSMKKDTVQSLSQVVLKTIKEEPDFSASISRDEKRLCNAKLRRMDYEKQLVDVTESGEEDESDDHCSYVVGDQHELLDSKCINDCLSSHFHDLLDPKAFSVHESAEFTLTDYKDFRSIASKTRSGRVLFAESQNLSVPKEDFLPSLIIRQHDRTHDVESVSHDLVHHQETVSRSSVKLLPSQSSSQIEQIYSRVKEADKKKVVLLPRYAHMTSLETVSLPHRRRVSSITSTDMQPTRSGSITSIETQLQSSQELYSLLRELTQQDGGVDRVAEIQAEVNKNRDIMDESRRSRIGVVGEDMWHNAVNAFSSDVVYKWGEEFENYRAMESLPLDSNRQLEHSLESNEIHVPEIHAPGDSPTPMIRKMSSDASSVGVLSSAGSVLLTGQAFNTGILNSPSSVASAVESNAAAKMVSSPTVTATKNTASIPPPSVAPKATSHATPAPVSSPQTAPSNPPSNETKNPAPNQNPAPTPAPAPAPTPSANPNPIPTHHHAASSAIQSPSEPMNISSEVINTSSRTTPVPMSPSSTLHINPSPSPAGPGSPNSRPSSVASGMSPPIHPVLTSPRLNIMGSPLISTPRLRTHPSSISIASGASSNTLNDITASPRLHPSSSLSFNVAGSPTSIRLSSPTLRTDAELFLAGRRRIPIVHNDNIVQPSQSDNAPIPTDTHAVFFNQDAESVGSEHSSFFSNNSNSPKETSVSTFIAVDEDMKPVLEEPVSQGTQTLHKVRSATLPVNSTLTRSKRALLRSTESADEVPEVASTGPKDSRSDVTRVSLFMNDMDQEVHQETNSSESDDFMQELDNALPAGFQQEFLSEMESMGGTRLCVCFIT